MKAIFYGMVFITFILGMGNVRVCHGDGHVTAFHVRHSRVEHGNTLISTVEPVFFENLGNGALKLNSFPFPMFQGPHTVVTDILCRK